MLAVIFQKLYYPLQGGKPWYILLNHYGLSPTVYRGKHWYIPLNHYGLSPTVYRGKTLVHPFKSLWTVPYSIQGENTGTYL